ncbi:MAG: 30S ribosomal protein S7 [Elusimicrobiota bacterium]
MSRKKKRIARPMKEDPTYKSILVIQYVNRIMQQGKKSLALNIVYDALEYIKTKLKDDPLNVLIKATNNVKPILEVKPRRIGGATYQVPVEVEPIRANALAIRWIIEFARAKKGRPLHEGLAMELLDAYKKEGTSIKKREDTHKMAEANKAFAHYKW